MTKELPIDVDGEAPVLLEQARPHDWSRALDLVFASLPELERRPHVANALDLLAGGELDPGGVWVARADTQILAALVCTPLEGASCLFWPPGVLPGVADVELGQRLVRAGLRWSRWRGCKLAQALVAPAHECDALPLVHAGFRLTTQLLSLQHDLDALPPSSQTLRFTPYAETAAGLYAETLLRTYEGTLDCPELNGVRTVDEILAGHRGAGKWRPDLWQLASDRSGPVGVLLLTELLDGLDWDLAYVGVIPEHRRRGLGRALALHAMRTARAGDALHLLLAVDGRNNPARNLYRSLGFVPVATRLVYLYFFEDTRLRA